MKAAATAMTILLALATPLVSADQTGTYTAVSPLYPFTPDCYYSPAPVVLGLGGACFTVPTDAEHYRVTLVDDVLGPGFGVLSLCETYENGNSGCSLEPICNGIGEGDVPLGTSYALVTAVDPVRAPGWCGLDAFTWVPTHGTITLMFSPSDG